MKIDGIKIAVVGGDLRQVRLCKLLVADGAELCTFALENYHFDKSLSVCEDMKSAVKSADCVIFPMPFLQQEGLLNAPLAREMQKADELILQIARGTIVLAGMVPDGIREFALKQGIEIIDYLKREELAIMNAAITAEGALQIAMENTSHILEGSRCAVIGYGRIGKALSRRLIALGAKVTVAARKYADFALAQSEGAKIVETTKVETILQTQDIIFNTVPQMVLPREKLLNIAPQALLIELASKPGGAGFILSMRMALWWCVKFCA